MGPVELLAGNATRAVELELAGYQWMTATGFVGFANTVAAHLGRAMLELDRNEEAEQWATTAREIATGDDPAAVGPALGVAARVRARRGEFVEAEQLGREAVASFDGTDFIDQEAAAHADLADVLRIAGRNDDEAHELRAAGRPAGYDFVYTSSLEIVSGGNPDLKEEKSDNYTVGAVFTPSFSTSSRVRPFGALYR